MVPTEPARDADAILRFWFEDCRPWQWFRHNPRFDQRIGKRFGALCLSAQAGGLSEWEQEACSALALVLLLDQFSRQLWRGEARAFAGDEQALRLSQRAQALGWITLEPQRARRQFWLMPMLHSENAVVVQRAIPLLQIHVDQATADLAQHNLDQLQRFGRYPWRDQARGSEQNHP